MVILLEFIVNVMYYNFNINGDRVIVQLSHNLCDPIIIQAINNACDLLANYI